MVKHTETLRRSVESDVAARWRRAIPKQSFVAGCAATNCFAAHTQQVPEEEPLKALPQGQYVKHYRYGFGVVTASDDEGTSIEFELHGSKKFVTNLMVVELSDLTPAKHLRAKWVKAAPAPRSPLKIASRKRAPNRTEPVSTRFEKAT